MVNPCLILIILQRYIVESTDSFKNALFYIKLYTTANVSLKFLQIDLCIYQLIPILRILYYSFYNIHQIFTFPSQRQFQKLDKSRADIHESSKAVLKRKELIFIFVITRWWRKRTCFKGQLQSTLGCSWVGMP